MKPVEAPEVPGESFGSDRARLATDVLSQFVIFQAVAHATG